MQRSINKNINKKGSPVVDSLRDLMWAHTGSNRGPSACKADALNQLSYAPERECKYRRKKSNGRAFLYFCILKHMLKELN